MNTGVHDASLTASGRSDNFASTLTSALFGVILLLENSGATVFDSLWLVLLDSALVIFVVVTLILLGVINLVALLLHAVRFLALVTSGLLSLSTDAAEFLVTLDEVIKTLVVHLVIHF